MVGTWGGNLGWELGVGIVGVLVLVLVIIIASAAYFKIFKT